ncbi:fumarylacetoacetate hydrolase family protein [Streptomyces albiflaviniger]|nr:fumarylacetoacetate hydrolase family protein [Streptomyces albiflaviniger]
MKLATIRTPDGPRAARLDGSTYTGLGFSDLGELLAQPDWRTLAAGTGASTHAADNVSLAPAIPRPGKVLCVGLNYRKHILEMGRDLPEHPTFFAKFTEALIGPRDDIALAPESEAVDWEAELTVVVGRTVRRADEKEAAEAIAGFTVMNDVTMRDWQYRTEEWLQGKTFEGTTPLGPHLVTPDELPGGTAPALTLSTTVDGETMQKADTSDLVFGPVDLIRYASVFVTLQPGDIIATGTPGGVGHARKPTRYLTDGSTLVTEIEGLGRLTNVARAS